MRAARDQANVGARARQLHAKISADRAGAIDADFHESFRARLVEFQQRPPAGFERSRESQGELGLPGFCQAAEAGRAAAEASSSNAVLMSRMLTTPIRL